GVRRHLLEERLYLGDVLNEHERPTLDGLQVEAGVLLAFAIALHHDPGPVRRNGDRARRILACRELARKRARSVELPDLSDSGDPPAEDHGLAVGGEPPDARRAHVDERLDAARYVGRDRVRSVLLEHGGRDAL